MGPTAYLMLSYHVAMPQILYFAFKPFLYGLVHCYIVSVLFLLQIRSYNVWNEYGFSFAVTLYCRNGRMD